MDTIFSALTSAIFCFINVVILHLVNRIEDKCEIAKPFKKVLFFNIFFIVIEIFNCIYCKKTMACPHIVYVILVYAVLFANVGVMLNWAFFTLELLGGTFKKSKCFKIVPGVIADITIVLLVVNIFTNFMFFFQPDNVSVNTKYILIMEVLEKINLLFMLVCSLVAFFNKTTEKRYALIAILYTAIIIIIGFFKFIFFDYPIYSAIYSLSAFIVYGYIMAYEVNNLWETAQNEKKLAVMMATIDGLTGLLNKLSFMGKVEDYIAENGSENCALIFFDMDHFKSINDIFGHQKGDFALREMSEKLKKMFRADELIGRMGGDEFCIFLPDVSNEIVENRIKYMNEQLRAVYRENDKEVKTSVSIGCVFCQKKNQTFIKLLSEADQTMYQVKKQGRDGHIIKTL